MKRTKNQNSFMYNGMTNLKHITLKKICAVIKIYTNLKRLAFIRMLSIQIDGFFSASSAVSCGKYWNECKLLNVFYGKSNTFMRNYTACLIEEQKYEPVCNRLTHGFSRNDNSMPRWKHLLSSFVSTYQLLSSLRRRTAFWWFKLHLNLFIVILNRVLLRNKTKHSHFQSSLQFISSQRMALFLCFLIDLCE